ncbi:transporter [Micrococcales bacterium 31B]|nr:transporter [Micrococcales bacterium 31B]
MTNIGLLFVGAVLFVNGISLLGGITPRGAAALNLFVGAMQTIFPTIALLISDRSVNAIWEVSGLYLFGFTYLYVGINHFLKNDDSGLGWYSIFVVGMAVVYAIDDLPDNPVFTVIWLVWGLMWVMFFLMLALGKTQYQPFTGWLLVIGAHVTCTVPAILQLKGLWTGAPWAALLTLGISVVMIVACVALAKRVPSIANRHITMLADSEQ